MKLKDTILDYFGAFVTPYIIPYRKGKNQANINRNKESRHGYLFKTSRGFVWYSNGWYPKPMFCAGVDLESGSCPKKFDFTGGDWCLKRLLERIIALFIPNRETIKYRAITANVSVCIVCFRIPPKYKILFVLFLIFYTASATNYHVKNGGDNALDGLSDATAWATNVKVNSFTFAPGDSILYKRGHTFTHKLIPPNSGTLANRICFGAYGEGIKPLFTGFEAVTGMTDSSGVWYKTLTNNAPKLNTVYVDGRLRAKARLPNTGYTQPATSPTTTSMSTTLTGTPNYAGAEVVARLTHWIIDVKTIEIQSVGTLNLSSAFSRSPGYAFGGNGFFLQNDTRLIDAQYEWAFDASDSKLRIKATAEPLVKVSTIDTLVFISKKNFITFTNISFEGANVAGFQIDTSYTVSVINCTIKDMGGAGIRGLKCSKFILQNDSLFNIQDNGISLFPYTDGEYIPVSPETRLSDSCLFDNNYFKNIGFMAGMGASSNVHYEGLMSVGNDCVITNNRIDSTGYIGLYFNGLRTLIENNYITNHCFLKDDGAGIYSGLGGLVPDSGSIIRSNIIINGIGNSTGTSTTTASSSGIYIDDLNKKVTIDGNTISEGGVSTITLHNCDSITVTNNLALNSVKGDNLVVYYVSTPMSGMIIKNNILYISETTKYPIWGNAGTNTFGILDSNYYLRPLNTTTPFLLTATPRSFASWKDLTGQDANSVAATPMGVSLAEPLLFINPTLSDSTVSLGGAYMDARGVLYNNSATIAAFQSKLLFKVPSEISAAPTMFTTPLKIIQR